VELPHEGSLDGEGSKEREKNNKRGVGKRKRNCELAVKNTWPQTQSGGKAPKGKRGKDLCSSIKRGEALGKEKQTANNEKGALTLTRKIKKKREVGKKPPSLPRKEGRYPQKRKKQKSAQKRKVVLQNRPNRPENISIAAPGWNDKEGQLEESVKGFRKVQITKEK